MQENLSNDTDKNTKANSVSLRGWLGVFAYKTLTLFVCVLLATAAFYSSIQPIVWVDNVFTFYSWFTGIFCLIALVSEDNETGKELLAKIKKQYEDGKHLPKWLDVVYYILIIGMLAAVARYWIAGVWIIKATTDLRWREKTTGKNA